MTSLTYILNLALLWPRILCKQLLRFRIYCLWRHEHCLDLVNSKSIHCLLPLGVVSAFQQGGKGSQVTAKKEFPDRSCPLNCGISVFFHSYYITSVARISLWETKSANVSCLPSELKALFEFNLQIDWSVTWHIGINSLHEYLLCTPAFCTYKLRNTTTLSIPKIIQIDNY